MENQNKNLRFLKNEAFASLSLEMLKNLAQSIIDCESYYVPDEMRLSFQDAKRELLYAIDKACGQIRFLRNYKNSIDNGEDLAKNLRFLKNEDFASLSLEMLKNLAQSIIDCESYYVPDEMRFSFQDAKRELLYAIDNSCGQIRFLRNYKNSIDNGEDLAQKL